jgi:Uma2 family endonuclease
MALEPSTIAATGILPASARPISVAEFHRLIDDGALAGDERVELLEGFLIQMSPQSLSHAQLIELLDELVRRSLAPRYAVRCQLPLTLARSEPEPDLAIVDRRAARRATRHPASAALVIEVAADSLDKDRSKAAIYAEAGVDEYWIVDVVGRRVEVHREPHRGQRTYRAHTTVARGELVSACLGEPIAVTALFRSRRRG